MMDQAQFRNAIQQAFTDKSAETLLSLNDEAGALYAHISSIEAENEAYKSKIAELQDTNQRLFLRITGEPKAPENEEPEEVTFEQFINKMRSDYYESENDQS